jgi:putative membrane protein
MKIKIAIVIGIVLLGFVTCINPLYPSEQVLQHIGTLILLIPLVVDIKKNNLYWSSFIGISLFTVFHIIGARYIYSFVPYNDWSKSAFDFNLNDFFDFKRNHYDRFVHLVFGILFFPYLAQMIGKWKGLSYMKVIIVVWLIIQTFSMFYELFEWSLTMVMSSESADNYNGQQGDMWDSQKDMACAMLGSTIMYLVYFIKGFNKSVKLITDKSN